MKYSTGTLMVLFGLTSALPTPEYGATSALPSFSLPTPTKGNNSTGVAGAHAAPTPSCTLSAGSGSPGVVPEGAERPAGGNDNSYGSGSYGSGAGNSGTPDKVPQDAQKPTPSAGSGSGMPSYDNSGSSNSGTPDKVPSNGQKPTGEHGSGSAPKPSPSQPRPSGAPNAGGSIGGVPSDAQKPGQGQGSDSGSGVTYPDEDAEGSYDDTDDQVPEGSERPQPSPSQPSPSASPAPSQPSPSGSPNTGGSIGNGEGSNNDGHLEGGGSANGSGVISGLLEVKGGAINADLATSLASFLSGKTNGDLDIILEGVAGGHAGLDWLGAISGKISVPGLDLGAIIVKLSASLAFGGSGDLSIGAKLGTSLLGVFGLDANVKLAGLFAGIAGVSANLDFVGILSGRVAIPQGLDIDLLLGKLSTSLSLGGSIGIGGAGISIGVGLESSILASFGANANVKLAELFAGIAGVSADLDFMGILSGRVAIPQGLDIDAVLAKLSASLAVGGSIGIGGAGISIGAGLESSIVASFGADANIKLAALFEGIAGVSADLDFLGILSGRVAIPVGLDIEAVLAKLSSSLAVGGSVDVGLSLGNLLGSGTVSVELGTSLTAFFGAEANLKIEALLKGVAGFQVGLDWIAILSGKIEIPEGLDIHAVFATLSASVTIGGSVGISIGADLEASVLAAFGTNANAKLAALFEGIAGVSADLDFVGILSGRVAIPSGLDITALLAKLSVSLEAGASVGIGGGSAGVGADLSIGGGLVTSLLGSLGADANVKLDGLLSGVAGFHAGLDWVGILSGKIAAPVGLDLSAVFDILGSHLVAGGEGSAGVGLQLGGSGHGNGGIGASVGLPGVSIGAGGHGQGQGAVSGSVGAGAGGHGGLLGGVMGTLSKIFGRPHGQGPASGSGSGSYGYSGSYSGGHY